MDPFDKLHCPYNMSHEIERYKMQFHLTKCRRNHPNAMKATCPFDSTHDVNEVELDFHVSSCPKRFMFDREAYVVEDAAGFTPTAEPVPNELTLKDDDEEPWDINPNNTYKPDLTNKSHIIKKIQGATPSERRKARMEGMRNYKPN